MWEKNERGRLRRGGKGRAKDQLRKILIILASIRRNTSSPYPWRCVMNASYCSPVDIRRSSTPPPPLLSLSSCHMYLFSPPSFPRLSPPLVYSGCDKHVTYFSSYLPFQFFLQHHKSSISTFFALISHLHCATQITNFRFSHLVIIIFTSFCLVLPLWTLSSSVTYFLSFFFYTCFTSAAFPHTRAESLMSCGFHVCH